jgi:hypothetical protein
LLFKLITRRIKLHSFHISINTIFILF